MPATAKRTFSLPAEQSDFIDSQVESGAFATGSEVVRAGLRALQEQRQAMDRWLRDEVGTVYDAMKADPGRAVTASKAFDAVRARHASRVKGAKRGA